MTSDLSDLDDLLDSDLDDDLDGDLDGEDGWRPAPAPAPRPADQPRQGRGDAAPRTTYFANPEEFVDKFLSKLIRRRLGGSYTWCRMWWAHSEALLRITAIWEAWEHHRDEPLGMSTWLLHHADPHMAILLSKDNGPFAACKPDRHTLLDPLPTAPAPAELWSASAFSDPPQDSTPS